MSRVMMVSSDCHVMARIEDYRPYVASKHLGAFEDWAAALPSYEGRLPEFFHEDTLAEHNTHVLVRRGAKRAIGISIGACANSKPMASWPKSSIPTPALPWARFRSVGARSTPRSFRPGPRPTTAGSPS
ncbi:MAG: hypothetical protein CL933_01415 [Deltaproteobacteria bacterium]|nr:hypothetical protein [Deltaproteobacteria bacterium]